MKLFLFSTEMVRAILDGRKTMTRRVVVPQPKVVHELRPDGMLITEQIFRSGKLGIQCPYELGARLWVRETWYSTPDKKELLGYKADGDIPHGCSYRVMPSIFMPRWASRITLEITEIRVERLQEITIQDVIKEGISAASDSLNWVGTTINHFANLWDNLNAQRGYSWESNPFVWCLTFKRMKEAQC